MHLHLVTLWTVSVNTQRKKPVKMLKTSHRQDYTFSLFSKAPTKFGIPKMNSNSSHYNTYFKLKGDVFCAQQSNRSRGLLKEFFPGNAILQGFEINIVVFFWRWILRVHSEWFTKWNHTFNLQDDITEKWELQWL